MRLFLCLLSLGWASLVNNRVSRVLDAQTQLLRTAISVEIVNNGDAAVSQIQLAPDATLGAGKLIFLTAKTDDDDLNINKDFLVTLKSPLAAGASVNLEISEIYYGGIRAFPTEIKQMDNQLVIVEHNLYYSSPYLTKVQNSKINIGTKKTESFPKQGKQEGNNIKYNEFKDIKGGSNTKVRVHYENNSPFLVAEKLEREVEVSHWGNVAITDKLWFKHAGAKLKGPFSRFDFQRQDTGPFITNWVMNLPLAAVDVSYRDLIGNISTSNLRADIATGETVLNLQPRFPMFGGWRNHFTIGYNLPSASYLQRDGSKFRLEAPCTTELYENFVIEEVEVKFILPEGADNVKINAGFAFERLPDTNRYTFLDTTGRVVSGLKASGITGDHPEMITVEYDWNSILIFKEPLLAISGWFVLFFVILVVARLDFSIKGQVKDKTE